MSSSKHSYFAFLDDSFGDKAFSLKLLLTREEQPVHFVKQSLLRVVDTATAVVCVLPALAFRLLEIWRFTEMLSRL